MRRVPAANGLRATPDTQRDPEAGASDGDEDYVIRTDKLNIHGAEGRPHGAAGRPPSSRGKGKGKSRELPMDATNGTSQYADGFENDADDLYD